MPIEGTDAVEAVEALPSLARAVAVDILVNGAQPRSALAERMGISAATITRLVKPLLATGVLVETDTIRPPGRGRAALALDVVPSRYRFAGVKLTTGAMYAVVTDLRGHILDREHIPLRSLRTSDVVATVADIVERFTAEGPIDALGVTVGGEVLAGEVVADSPFLRWRDVPLRSLLVERLGALPVHLDNDVVGLTKAQHWFGQGKHSESFALLTVGAGIGYGLVVRNALVPTLVAPMSHYPVDPTGPPCPLGHRGCMTAYLAAESIASAASAGYGHAVTFDRVLELARAEDPVASRVVREAAHALGHTASTVAATTGVERIILSGEGVEVAQIARPWLDAGFHEYDSHRSLHAEIAIRPMDFFEWARGAAVVAIQAEFPERTRSVAQGEAQGSAAP